MSQTTLTVPTAFTDISDLAEGLADRVDEERLMLYGPEPVEDGAWVRFEVLLADQSAALEGVGRAITSIDGGEERPEVARFDVVLDSIQFEGTSEVVYERILMARERGDQTGEVSLDEVEHIEGEAEAAGMPLTEDDEELSTRVAQPAYEEQIRASAEEEQGYAVDDEGEPTAIAEDVHLEGGEQAPPPLPGGEAAPVEASADWEAEQPAGGMMAAEAALDHPLATESGFQDVAITEQAAGGEWVHTAEVALDQVDAAYPSGAPAPEPPSAPAGFQIAGLDAGNGRALTRPSRTPSWHPQAMPTPESSPSSGLFAFSGPLPIPSSAPRPDLDPSMRVRPAPRPGDEAAHAGAGAVGAVAAAPAYDEGAAYGHEAYDEGAAYGHEAYGEQFGADQGYDQAYDQGYGEEVPGEQVDVGAGEPVSVEAPMDEFGGTTVDPDEATVDPAAVVDYGGEGEAEVDLDTVDLESLPPSEPPDDNRS